MNYDVKKTAQIIKELRSVSGMSQEKIAEDIGLNLKTYQSAEQGSRGVRIDTLCVMAEYYEVSLDYLISGTKEVIDLQLKMEKLTVDQKAKVCGIVSNMIETLGWVDSHKVG